MPTQYPTDRFDSPPESLSRTGAHRAPARSGRGWIGFAWAALATGLLVGSGILGLTAFGNSLNIPFTQSAASETEEPVPTELEPEPAASVLDPGVPVTVLNGTSTTGLAATVGDALVAAGWCGATGPTAPEEGPCAGQAGLGTRLTADTPVDATVVYYNGEEWEAAARGVVESLGVGTVLLSDVYPDSPITVVVGPDYSPPAG